MLAKRQKSPYNSDMTDTLVEAHPSPLQGVLDKLHPYTQTEGFPPNQTFTPIDHLLPPPNGDTAIPPDDNDPSKKDVIERSPIYDKLRDNPQMSPLLELYDATRNDLQKEFPTLQESLKGDPDFSLYADIFKGEVWYQTDILLKATKRIAKGEKASVMIDGERKEVQTIEGIQSAFLKLHETCAQIQRKKDTPTIMKADIDDFRNAYQESEMVRKITDDTVIFVPEGQNEYIKQLKARNLIASDFNEEPVPFDSYDFNGSTSQTVTFPLSKLVIQNRYKNLSYADLYTNKPLFEGDTLPGTIILEIPSSKDLYWHNIAICMKLREDLKRLEPSSRPTVILHANGFRLGRHETFEGFHYAENWEELERSIDLAHTLAAERKLQTFDRKQLEPKQRESYNASHDLREWEHITADTSKSLEFLFQEINSYNSRSETAQESLGDEDRKVTAILDLGTGEGRIAGMLARLGLHVVGIDISKEMLDRGRKRLEGEGAYLRGENNDESLSAPVLERLKQNNQLPLNDGFPLEIILDDEEARKHYVTLEGSFFDLYTTLEDYLKQWIFEEQFNDDIDPFTFFGIEPSDLIWGEKIFSKIGFDMSLFNWHTFCEIGNSQNQAQILRQVRKVLQPGGELVIEIPDRHVEPYKSALDKYHTTHPDDPYGTLRDPKPGGNGEYPPRYFPDAQELVNLLKSVGFEVDGEMDVKSYDIETVNPEIGEKSKQFTEFFITARKPKI